MALFYVVIFKTWKYIHVKSESPLPPLSPGSGDFFRKEANGAASAP